MHSMPSRQVTQAPSRHTFASPQPFPLASFPDGMHFGAPVEQSVAPCLHGSPASHDIPAVQATQAPALLQILLAPHAVPAVLARPESLHEVSPPVHSRVPS